MCGSIMCDFIDAQDAHPGPFLLTSGAFGLTLEDFLNRGFVQPGFVRHRFDRTTQAMTIDMPFEPSRVAPLGIETNQSLGEGTTAMYTLEKTTGKVQKRAFPPDIQIAHASRLPFMALR